MVLDVPIVLTGDAKKVSGGGGFVDPDSTNNDSSAAAPVLAADTFRSPLAFTGAPAFLLTAVGLALIAIGMLVLRKR